MLNDRIDTPIGALRLQFDADGLHAVTIVGGRHTEAQTAAEPHGIYPHRDAFARYFDGELAALAELQIVLHGTEFQQRVWQALRLIPPGATRSYAHLAKQTGHTRASRAVGTANGANRLHLVVPCHRVIRADGSLGGFSAGIGVKRWLLAHEGAEFRLTA